MILGKLNGYDEINDQYTIEGVQSELPNVPFIVVNDISSLTSEYINYGTSSENWLNNTIDIINSETIVGFKDILCLRKEILPLIYAIAGTDFANFANLNIVEKSITLKYFPTKIIDAQGNNFFFYYSGGLEQGLMNITYYQEISIKAREKRYINIANYVYQYLGKSDGLKAERNAQQDHLDTGYTRRGIVYQSEDGLLGLGDWILSNGDYWSTGLKSSINNNIYTMKINDITVDQFCDNCINIIQNGIY